MTIIQISSNKLDKVLTEQHSLTELTYEVDQALRFYEEHPQYPIDYHKIRENISKLYKKMFDLEHTLTDLGKKETYKDEDSSTDIWL
ncbi:MAG: hypothetical protein AAB255_00745 [Bacteroidota bacterium]